MNVGLSDVTIEYNSDALRTLFGNGCIFGPSLSAWYTSLSVLQSTLCIMSSSLVSSMLTVWSLEISSGWSEMSLTSGSGSGEGGGIA